MKGSGAHDPSSTTSNPAKAKIGLALAGGAPGGAVYEIGALRMLEEAIDGLDLHGLEVYVGVSAGAFISSCLVNRLTTAQMCRSIVSQEPGEHPFVPETFFTPSYKELGRRVLTVPRLLAESVWHYLSRDQDTLVAATISRLGEALPVGCFDNEPIRHYLEKVLAIKRRTNDFRKLKRKLFVVATDIDSGQAVRFGAPGWDHVPISKAVQASTALPGLYPPVEIDGRAYVDGILLKTLHASVAMEAGANLVLCVNPIVPVDTARAVEEGFLKRARLTDRGLVTVLAQAVRTLIHSRLEVGMAAYQRRYDADIVLVEPKRQDYEMFFTNIFGFASRRRVLEHAYEATRAELLERYDELAPVLSRHGLTLRRDILENRRATIWHSVDLPDLVEGDGEEPGAAIVSRLDDALGRLERLLDEPEERAAAG